MPRMAQSQPIEKCFFSASPAHVEGSKWMPLFVLLEKVCVTQAHWKRLLLTLERGILQADYLETLCTLNPFLRMEGTVLQAPQYLPKINRGTGVPCSRLYNLYFLFAVYVISTPTSGLWGRLVRAAFCSVHSGWHGMGQSRNWAISSCPGYKRNIIAAANLMVLHGTRHSGTNTLPWGKQRLGDTQEQTQRWPSESVGRENCFRTWRTQCRKW